MNPNLLVRYLQKPASDFTRADIIRYCEENEVEFVNFHYCGWDGKLKTLNFVIESAEHLEGILSAGERVDGSSLFPFIEAGKSDLYVIPKYRTAFRNPFSEIPTVDLLCSFYNREGEPFESSPEYILHKAHLAFQETTGLKMETMGELEYYIIADDEEIYPVADQRGYHESAPFNKFTNYRVEAMRLIAQAGGQIKYGHSEVGNFTHGGKIYEQNEIEFLPVNIEDAADQLVVAKWIMRQLAYEYGVTLTFAPKITVGKAGSGMHVHCKFTKDGKSMMLKRRVDRRMQESHRRIYGSRHVAARFRQPQPIGIHALGASSGSSHLALLVVLEPQRLGACSARMGQQRQRHGSLLQPA